MLLKLLLKFGILIIKIKQQHLRMEIKLRKFMEKNKMNIQMIKILLFHYLQELILMLH